MKLRVRGNDSKRSARLAIESEMNFRKGCQRLYAVLAFAWICTCLYSLWPTAKYVSDVLLWDKDHLLASPDMANIAPPYTHPDEVREFVERQYGTDAYHGWLHVATPVWLRLAAIAFVPPAFFYFLFFYVCRWVYRGFKRGQTVPVG